MSYQRIQIVKKFEVRALSCDCFWLVCLVRVRRRPENIASNYPVTGGVSLCVAVEHGSNERTCPGEGEREGEGGSAGVSEREGGAIFWTLRVVVCRAVVLGVVAHSTRLYESVWSNRTVVAEQTTTCRP